MGGGHWLGMFFFECGGEGSELWGKCWGIRWEEG